MKKTIIKRTRVKLRERRITKRRTEWRERVEAKIKGRLKLLEGTRIGWRECKK